MSPDHRLKTAATRSSVWDGQPIKRVRAGDGVTILAGRRLAMHVMVWMRFHDHVEAQSGSMGNLAAVRDLAGKIAEHAARIAGVLTIVNDTGATVVELRQRLSLLTGT